MTEIRLTVTVADHGYDLENGERFLDGFMQAHPEVGPSVSQNTQNGTLRVTFSLEAEDVNAALESSRRIFMEGAEATGLAPSEVLRVEAERVSDDELAEDDAREAVPA